MIDGMGVDDELLKILKDEEAQAATFYTSELAQAQAEALDRYHARPYGDEAEGRSKIVTHDIEDTINWVMPALMRTFAPSDDLIACDDDGLDDGDEVLKSTAQYLSHLFFKRCGGEHALHDFIFDGLLSKLGVMRTAWEDARPSPPIIREGMTVEQLLRYEQDPEYQILEIAADGEASEIEATAEDVPAQPEQAMPGLMAPAGQPAPPPGLMAPQQGTMLQPAAPQPQPIGMTYSVKLQRTPRTGKPVVETISPENFLITAQSKSIEDAAYHGARFETFMADVIGNYPEQAHLLDPDGNYATRPADEDELESDVRLQARFPLERDTGHQSDDEFREKVWLKIEYLRCDYDRDNIVELRRIVRVGDIILENDIVEESEFTLWSPIRVSHRAIGRSMADTLVDIQKIRTVLTRRAMDSLSQSLTPRTFYDKRMADDDPTFVDQLLDHDVGSAIGVSGEPSKAVLIQTTPDVSGPAFQAIEYWDRRSEEASGVNRHAMGIQPQAITDTKGGIENLQSAANARIEQIARHVGTSLEVALGKLLRIVVRHQHTPQIFKVSGKRVQWDARRVSDDMTVTVHVGMTAESREKKLAMLAGIAGKQEQILLQMGPANPLATLKHYRHTLGQMVQVMGYRDDKPFFAEVPDGWQPPPAGPDPKTVEVQGKQQIAATELAGKQKLQDAELAGKRQVAEFEAANRSREKLREIEIQRELALIKSSNELAMARDRMAMEKELAREKMAQEREIAMEAMKMKASQEKPSDGDGYRAGGRLDA